MVRELSLIHKSFSSGGLSGYGMSSPELQLIDISDFDWKVQLSDFSDVQLISTTKNAISIGEIPSFISAFCHTRLHESDQALQAMQTGMVQKV